MMTYLGAIAHDNAFQRATHLYSYLQGHSLLPNLESPTYLDVGCGSGGFLTMFASKGFKCYGNDPDPYAFNHINTMPHKHDLRECAGEDMNYKESFDIVTIIGSLEHCQDPLLILRKIHSYLKPSGLLIVEGRFSPVSASTSYLNFNHQRVFVRSNFK